MLRRFWLLIRRSAGPFIDPLRQKRNLALCQRRFFVGHPRNSVMRAAQHLNQQAVGTLPAFQRRPTFAAFPSSRRRIETQPALLLGTPMTSITMLFEHRLYVF